MSAVRKHSVRELISGATAEVSEYATRGARALKNERPQLKLVSPLRPEKASRGVFALLITGLLGAGLVVMLLINTSLSSGAFVVSELQAQKNDLTVQAEALAGEVDALSAPGNLATRARAMGMKQSKNPVFLNLADGSVLGKPNGAQVSSTSPLPSLKTTADLTVTELADQTVAADFPPAVTEGYDPAAADAAAAGKSAGAAAAEDGAWGEVVEVTPESAAKSVRSSKSGVKKAKKAPKVASGDAGLTATPIG